MENLRLNNSWTRHFVYRTETTKTTWKFRLAIVCLAVVMPWSTSSLWTERLGQGLVCNESKPRSDAIIVENFDPSYLLFERASALHRMGTAPQIFVTVQASEPEGVNAASAGVADVWGRFAHMINPQYIPIREIEPISLHAAYQILEFLRLRNIRSVVVITSGFRSRRSMDVYQAVFGSSGIDVHCVPVFTQHTVTTWTRSWHGVQQVVEQFIKLQYYRFYVIPFVFRRS